MVRRDQQAPERGGRWRLTASEQQRRFEAAEKIRIGDTDLRRQALRPTEASLRAHFASEVGRAARPLENPHVEPRVDPAASARATPAAVLLPIVLREPEPTILLTRRHPGISFPGHWVFPGGRCDDDDPSPVATALRETREEIGLDPTQVEVLGRLGDYVSHSGFRIVPTIALVRPPLRLRLHPGEVDEVAELPLRHVLDSTSYFLFRFADRPDRAHFAMDCEIDGLLLTGVSVSIAIGFYGELLKTHVEPG